MGNEIWRVTCRFLSGNAVSPKNVGRKNWPLCDVTVASLYKRVVNGSVRMLDDAIRLGIVCGYADESISDGATCGVYASVAKLVMSIMKYSEAVDVGQ